MSQKENSLSKTDISFSHLLKFLLFLVLVAAIVYGNSLNNKFVFDDQHLVQKNLFIRSFENLPTLFKTGLHHFENVFQGEGTFYRPIIGLTYMFDYFLYALDPSGYHITNILWQVLAAFLVYLLIRIIFKSFILGAVSSLLFLIHPIQTEAVTYISGRADLIATSFLLLYLVFFVLDLKKTKQTDFLTKEFVLANISLFLAFLSKEIAFTSLPLLGLIFYIVRSQREEKPLRLNALYPYLIGFIALLFLYFKLRSNALGDWAYATETLPFGERMLTTVTVLAEYFRILLFPLGLHMERTVQVVDSLLNIRLAFSSIILGIIIALAIKHSKRSSYVFFGTIWFLITIFPFLNIIPLNATMAEHWLYVPSIGFFFLVAYIINEVYRKAQKRILKVTLVSVFSLIIATFGMLTIKQNAYWKDDITFYLRTLKYSPGSLRCIGNLATMYTKEGKHDEAIALFEKGIESNPKEYQLYNNLATVYLSLKKYKQAEDTLLEAIAIKPKVSFPYNNLGIVYENQGKMARAEEAYKNAIKRDKNFYEAYYNLGTLLYQEGRIQEAKEFLRRVEEIYPNYKDTRRFLQ